MRKLLARALVVAVCLQPWPAFAQQAVQVQSNSVDIASEATMQSVLSALSTANTSLDAIEGGLSLDAVHGDAVIATGPQLQGEAKDIDGGALPNVVTEGESVRLATTLSGALLVTIVPEAGTSDAGASMVSNLSSLGSATRTEDVAETAGGILLAISAVRRDAAASSTPTDAENATVNTDALGLLWTRQLDPCSGVAKNYYVVDIADGTNTEIANAVASQFFYICSVNLVAAGATVVLISEDDTDTCSSPSAGLHGGTGGTTSEGWSFAANGGIALGDGSSTVMKTSTANRYFCIDQTASVQLSGTISYVSAP